MTLNKQIILVLAITAFILITTNTQNESQNSLVILTTQNHQPVLNSQQLISLNNKLQNIQAFTINTANKDKVIEQLKKIIKDLNITKQQVSSLVPQTINQQKIEKSLNFQQIQDLKQVFLKLSQKNNIILSINSVNSKQRVLIQEEQHELLISGLGADENSQMFLNMTPSTLSGLLVSLFLIVMLVIAIGCLYEVKTNDKFGRNNLWVGKEN